MDNQTPGFELIEREIEEMEKLGVDGLPSLNHFLEKNKLFMTKEDIRALRELLKKKKYKLILVRDWKIIKRGRKK